MRPFCSLLRNRLHVITPTVHGLQNDLSYSSGRKLTDAWARERDKERKGGRTRSRVREKAEARYYFRMILCSESEKKKLFFELTAKNIRHNGCTCSQLLRLLEFLNLLVFYDGIRERLLINIIVTHESQASPSLRDEGQRWDEFTAFYGSVGVIFYCCLIVEGMWKLSLLA